MSVVTTFDLQVFDPRNRLAVLLGENEERLEAGASRAFGEPVDLRIRRETFRAIAEAGRSGTGDAAPRTVGVVQLGARAEAPERFRALLQTLSRHGLGAVFVVTTREIFNDHRFQGQLLEHLDPHRLAMFIEDGPEADQADLVKGLGQLLATALQDLRGGAAAGSRTHPPFLRIGRRLRDEASGRLDGKKIAALFGIPESEVAGFAGVTRQALSKTPDARSIQDKLHPFEIIARGLLPVDEDERLFRQWLNTPSDAFPKIDGRSLSPMDVIRRGHPEVVAGLVEDSLSGQPS